MIKIFFTAAVTSSFFLIACTDNNQAKNDNTSPSTSIAPLLVTDGTQSTGTALQANEAGVALNPQHGEPGHRCDIAVGAPLNSPASSTNTPVVTTTDPATTIPVQATTTTSPKLNPKHGDPGHRCDLAVGAPLDGSKQ